MTTHEERLREAAAETDRIIRAYQEEIATEATYVEQRFVDTRDIAAPHKAFADVNCELSQFLIENGMRPVSVRDFEDENYQGASPSNVITRRECEAWLHARGYRNFRLRLDGGHIAVEPQP